MYTPVILDKTRNFRYGMVAADRIEKILKVPIGKIDFNNLTMGEAAVIIWAGLVHEDASLTPEIVMQLIDEHSSFAEVAAIMGRAISEAFGGNEEEKN